MTELNQKTRLIADIVPDAKLPNGITQTFSYAIPDEFERRIKKGSIVKISLRKKNITGVVFGIRKESEISVGYKLKKINGLFEDYSALPMELIELSKYVSEYYHSPLSFIIKTILPEHSENKSRKDMSLNQNIAIDDISENIFDKVNSNLKIRNLLIHNLGCERHSLYLKTINRLKKKNGQTLLLFPEYFDIYNFSFFYINALGKENVSILTSELSKNQYFEEWKKVMDGSAKLIIGTRQAVFAPFNRLDLIIIDNEHSSGFKQWDMNPRYNAVDICEKLSSIWNAKIILSSPSPSVETYYKSKNGDLSLINITENSPEKQYEIVDMKMEREKKNFSVFSEKLKEDLMDQIYKRRQAVIFIPKLGLNTVTKCKDCEYMAHCEDCETLLSSFRDNLYCTHCKKKFDLMKKCPRCGGQNISAFGYGIEIIENEIKTLFKGKNISISRLDSTIAENKSKQKKIYKDFTSGKIDILIGTQMAIKNWNMDNLTLIVILFPEIIFNQPDFRSRERSLQFLLPLKNEAGAKRKIYIETFNKENAIFKILAEIDIIKIYEEELSHRRNSAKIGYPPFSHIIKLIYKDENKDRCKIEALDLYSRLYDKINSESELASDFEIIRPFPAQSFKEYGKYRYHIIIKHASGDIAKRDLILSEIKKDWIIDVDPDSLL